LNLHVFIHEVFGTTVGTTNQNAVACEQNVQLACSDKACI